MYIEIGLSITRNFLRQYAENFAVKALSPISSTRDIMNKKKRKKKPEKIRPSTGFEPVTSAIPVRCSTN